MKLILCLLGVGFAVALDSSCQNKTVNGIRFGCNEFGSHPIGKRKRDKISIVA